MATFCCCQVKMGVFINGLMAVFFFVFEVVIETAFL